ncbi:MAG: DUF190 domain-containing protein [Bacteroidota bacterium]
MKLSGQGKLLRIFCDEDDRYGGKQLFESIMYLAKEKGLAGATIIRGIEGFGARHHIHKSTLVELSSNLPIIIEIVDTEENVEMILPMIDDMIEKAKCGALITVERIDVRKYTAGE